MRYHYEKPSVHSARYGSIYICNHPLYNRCTLYKISNKGLAVIQQRYDPNTKMTWWSEIDDYLVDDLYLHTKFKGLFDSRSGEATDGLYPTITIRQLMWALKLKPLRRERWETYFDRRDL